MESLEHIQGCSGNSGECARCESDGINLVKEDSQGNKFNVKIGPNGLSIVGSKDGKPVEIKVDAAGMQVGRDGKQFQIPMEELKEQLKLIKGAKKESVE